jgi:guanylate cyclase
LLNVLRKEMAEVLKEGRSDDRHPLSGGHPVLFADVVGFTPLSQGLSPEELVDLLNDIFSFFDSFVEKYGLEKIRTIGDAHMAASGVPVPREDHAQTLAPVALEMNGYRTTNHPSVTQPLVFRLGLSSGPAVAGVTARPGFNMTSGVTP